jgi:hypothetical protein
MTTEKSPIETKPARQFTTEIRGDYVYVVIGSSATGPCFALSEEFKARRYANVLNRSNRYPLIEA